MKCHIERLRREISFLFSKFTKMFLLRYIGVCKALNASRWSNIQQARIHVTVLVIVSGLLEIVRYFDFEFREYHFRGKTYTIMFPTKLYEDDLYQLLYRNILMTGLRSILPIVLTIVLTTCLVKAVLQLSRQKVQFLPSSQINVHRSSSEASEDSRVTRTLILIAVLMIVLNTPTAIYPILYLTLDVGADPCSHFYHYFATIAEAMAAMNSAVNFYIYYPTMPTLRAELARISANFRCLCGKINNKVHTTARRVSVMVIDIVTESNNTKRS